MIDVYSVYFEDSFDSSKDNIEILINFLNKLSNSYSIDTKTKLINFNLTGSFKLLSDDEIIIEMGDIIPYLTNKSIQKSKNKIVLLNKLFFEIFIRQFPFLSQINCFSSIFYAKKGSDIITLRNIEYEDNLAFYYVNLQ